jgi:hypothetical protein
MIAGKPAHEAPPDHAAGIQDRYSALQVSMPLGARLPESTAQRAEPCGPRPRRESRPHSTTSPEQRVRGCRWVCENLTIRHPRFLEVASEGRIPVPDENEPGPGRLDFVLDAAQLRRLLFAEQSTVVAEPDQHDGSALVDGTKRDLAAIEIEHHGLAEPSTGHIAS